MVLPALKTEMGLKEIIAAECVSSCFSFLEVKLISKEMIIMSCVVFMHFMHSKVLVKFVRVIFCPTVLQIITI